MRLSAFVYIFSEYQKIRIHKTFTALILLVLSKKCVNVHKLFLILKSSAYVFLIFFKFSGCFLMILCLYGHTVQQHMVEHTSYSMAPKDIYPKYNKDSNRIWTVKAVLKISALYKILYIVASKLIIWLSKTGQFWL